MLNSRGLDGAEILVYACDGRIQQIQRSSDLEHREPLAKIHHHIRVVVEMKVYKHVLSDET